MRDLRFGLRMLRRNPGFAAVAVLTLALAIAANTAIFSFTSALLLRPFPYPQPEQLLSIALHPDLQPGTVMRYELLRDRAQSFSIAAYAEDNASLTGGGEPAQIPTARVTPNFFSLLGVSPALGRLFVDADGHPESRPVAVLTSALWRSRFHSNPAIAGSTVDLDGVATTILGVLPADARFPFLGKDELFTPRYFEYSLFTPQRLRMGVGYLNYLGRLHPGVALTQANAELATLDQQYIRQNPGIPDADPSLSLVATPLRDSVVAGLRTKLFILTAAVGLLLLIGCANVASLLLSRALARRRELAVRAALGASRATVVRQLLVESLLLSCAAGLLGVLLGGLADRALVAWAAKQLPQGIPIALDARVLLFAVAVSLLTGLLTGIFPALQLARANLNGALREEGRGLSGSRSRARLRSLLVVGQVALSLVLLIAAGLLVRSFAHLLSTDPGFVPDNVLTMEIVLPTEKYARPQQQVDFFRDLLARVQALPGVRSAAISAALPLDFRRMTPMLPEGQPEVPLPRRPTLDIEAVSPAWFTTLNVPLLAGRVFTDADNSGAPRVLIVNESFARRFWPGENPIGKHVVVGRGPDPSQVIGVSRDIHNRGLALDPQPQVYIPFAQLPWGHMNLLVRTAVAPMSMAALVHAQVSAVDPDQPVTAIQTVDDLMDTDRAQPRFTMLLLGVFSVTALALAAIGLAAMLAWTVLQRRQELAIRLALGADHSDLLWLVIRHGLVLAVAGIAVGWVAGLGLTRLMAGVLYKTSTHDWETFVLAPMVFLVIAWFASWLPARRATRVDPIETLKAG